jgi:hypothetical protein
MKALRLLALSAAASTLITPVGGTRAQLLITGNDEKVSFDETGKTVRHAAGKDTVSIIDIHDPTKPRIVANLPLMNSITGPPVNLAITPDQHLALVANSLDWVKDGEDWKGVPDNKIYVIDLTASPPVQITTVEAGKQPSGMVINEGFGVDRRMVHGSLPEGAFCQQDVACSWARAADNATVARKQLTLVIALLPLASSF